MAAFPYPRKAELAGSAEEQSVVGAFIEQMEEFDSSRGGQVPTASSLGTSEWRERG